MMNKPILLLLFLFSCAGAFAQNEKPSKSKVQHDSTAYYMRNDYDMAYNEADAKFLRLIIKADSGLFRIEEYYLDAKPKLLVNSFEGNIHFEPGMQGKRVDYYPNGNIKTVSYYEKGKGVGEQELHYPNGNLYTVMRKYDNADYLKKCLDSLGNMLADDGNGKWIDYDNFFESKTEGQIINGRREGEWVETARTGEKSTGIYKSGVLVSGDLFTSNSTTFGRVETPPTFNGGESAFNKFLAKNIRYPVVARENNIQGRVIISFVVEKDGSLTNLRIVRGIGSGCDEEVIRIISLSPRWNPGYQNGKPVRVNFSVPIAFALEREKSTFIPGKPSN